MTIRQILYELLPEGVIDIIKTILFYKCFLFSPQKHKMLSKNIRVKDIHNGERCFIVGNGPSILEQDLALLKDEIVFTFNYLPRSDCFASLKSNYHVMLDPNDFNGTCDEAVKAEYGSLEENISIFNRLEEKPCIIMNSIVLEYDHKEILNQYDQDKLLYYLDGRILKGEFKKKLDMTKMMPGIVTSLLAAVYCAMYMGCREIIIIGLDMFSEGVIRVYENGQYVSGRYLHAESQKPYFEWSDVPNELIIETLQAWFADFRRTENYAKRHGVKILNATLGGVVDVFERIKFEDIVKKQKS